MSAEDFRDRWHPGRVRRWLRERADRIDPGADQ